MAKKILRDGDGNVVGEIFEDGYGDGDGIVGKQAPDFEMEMEDGSKKQLSDFLKEGKPIVLDFYANF
jgi:hypothetical protein